MESYHFLEPKGYYEQLLAETKKSLSWKNKNSDKSFADWKNELRAELKRLIGEFPQKVDPKLILVEKKEMVKHTQLKYIIRTSTNNDVPVHILVPNQGGQKYPTMICLQGHTAGAQISLGIKNNQKDEEMINGGRDFAVQAVDNGFVAVVIEQKCFGERKDSCISKRSPNGCYDSAVKSLLLGRTIISERVYDVMKVIDFIEKLDFIEKNFICCMGNSGGGTISLYLAALDERIKLACVSCSFCTYEESIFKIYHCLDNYIPGILKYAEMYDIAGLICPRDLIVIAGIEDHLFPIESVKKAFDEVEQIYKSQNQENCFLQVGSGGHKFYPESAWPLIKARVELVLGK